MLTLPEVSKDQMYPLKLKGISICFSLLKASLSGNYVNFGVFRLYGDDALDSALQMFVKLLLSIPQHDLMVSFQEFLASAFHTWAQGIFLDSSLIVMLCCSRITQS